ncbi:hypothetical protein [Sneathiella glossodoripedis]|uniref:hypothetical protein n=1 Tax=Sneathiella glossodoripedis TaxID=418853 RepID=UPI0018FF6CFD|nr:hypothetical protein [Sneathiella glossodoripedis]
MTEAFPGVSIIRPSVVFGCDDSFTLKFASLSTFSPVLPLLEGGKNLMQPVFVEDLAEAIVKIINTPEAQGKVYEFGGPEQLSLAEIIGRITNVTKRKVFILPLPEGLMKIAGFVLGLLPGAPMLTIDQVKLLKSDNIVSGSEAGFAELGITPTRFSRSP